MLITVQDFIDDPANNGITLAIFQDQAGNGYVDKNRLVAANFSPQEIGDLFSQQSLSKGLRPIQVNNKILLIGMQEVAIENGSSDYKIMSDSGHLIITKA